MVKCNTVRIVPSGQTLRISPDLVAIAFECPSPDNSSVVPVIDVKKRRVELVLARNDKIPHYTGLKVWFTPHCLLMSAKGIMSALNLGPNGSARTFHAEAQTGRFTLYFDRPVRS